VKPRIIALAGISGCGKTTLAQTLSERLSAPIISLDDYYLPLTEFNFEERTAMNFDAPEMVDFDLLAEHLEALHRGESIPVPEYDYVDFTRSAKVNWIHPSPFLILEGQLALFDARIAEQCAVRVFLKVDTDICLSRRVMRDVMERGRTPDEVHWRFHTHVLPAFRQMQTVSREHSNLELVFPYTVREAADQIESLARQSSPLLT
jgi:uridine kinase